MLAITTPLKTRLQALPALAGWALRAATDTADRRVLPAVAVRCSGAQVADSKAGAVMVAPQWTVTLVVQRSDQAADELDAAFAAVIESLHNWMPGRHGSRGWEPLRLARVTEPDFIDEGLAGLDLTFTTGAKYDGQD